MSKYKKCGYGEESMHECVFTGERESACVWYGRVREWLCVLEIYGRWVTRSLGCVFPNFPHSEAKYVARRQTLLTNNSA